MRKIHLIGFVIFAVLAFSAMSVASAFAEDIEGLCLQGSPPVGALLFLTETKCEKMETDTPEEGEWWLGLEWLVKNTAITTAVEVETPGLLTLIHLAGGFLEPETVVHCEGFFDGSVEQDGIGLITKVLSSTKEEISLTKELACTSIEGVCEEGTLFISPENLPWLVTLESMDPPAGQTTDLALALFSSSGNGNPAYEILCAALGSHHETLCEGETSVDLELMPGSPTSLLVVFNASELEREGLEALCQEDGIDHNNVVLGEGEGEMRTATGEEIDVS